MDYILLLKLVAMKVIFIKLNQIQLLN